MSLKSMAGRVMAAMFVLSMATGLATAQIINTPKIDVPPPNPLKEAQKRAEQARNDAAKDAKATIDNITDKLKNTGGKLSDEGKKAGAMVSNTWKWLSNDLGPLNGWVRNNCQPGDILVGGNPVNVDLGQFAHVAIVTDVQNEKLFEANCTKGSDKPGTHEISWPDFSKHYQYIFRLRVKNLTGDQTAKVVGWVKNHKGKPYRYPVVDGLKKNDDTRMYCSQLVWVAYKRVLDIDIQGGAKSEIIHPDDLYKCDLMDKEKVR